MTERSEGRLTLDLDAFINEHRRCGDLDTGMMTTEPERVWMTSSCGARIEHRVRESPAC